MLVISPELASDRVLLVEPSWDLRDKPKSTGEDELEGELENELVIHKEKESFLLVPLLALPIQKDLSEIAGWVGPTKKGMGLLGLAWAELGYLVIYNHHSI